VSFTGVSRRIDHFVSEACIRRVTSARGVPSDIREEGCSMRARNPLGRSACAVVLAGIAAWPERAQAVDCNGNTVEDAVDIARGTSADCNLNGAPDECDLSGVGFAPVVYYSVPRGAFVVQAADVDGEHGIDLVVIGGQSTDNVSVLRNQGDGTFTGPEDYTIPAWSNALALGQHDLGV
jgi:hypothetical protein